MLKRQGFRVATKAERSHSISGTVLAQEPPAGRRVSPGTEVRLVIAEQLKVPTVTGMTLERAENTLRSAGFTMGKVEINPVAGSSGPDTVQSQNPAAGTAVTDAVAVNILVQRAGVIVPRVENLPWEKAEATLSKLGLTPHLEYLPSTAVAGTVISQSPRYGLVATGSTIDLVIARGLPPGAKGLPLAPGEKKMGTPEDPSPPATPAAQNVAITRASCTSNGRWSRLQVNGTATAGQEAYLVIVVNDEDFRTQTEISGNQSYFSCGGVPQNFVPSAGGNNGCTIPARDTPTTWEFVAFGGAVHGSFEIRAVHNIQIPLGKKSGGPRKAPGEQRRIQTSDTRSLSCR